MNPWIAIPMALLVILLTCFTFFVLSASESKVVQGFASWYDRRSCRIEGTSGIMADGAPLDDEALTCATWDFPLGSILLVKNTLNNRNVAVRVTDRGPNEELRRQGRVIDLTRAAFSCIADLDEGIIRVRVTQFSKP